MRKRTKFTIPTKYILIFLTFICAALIIASFLSGSFGSSVKNAAASVVIPVQKGMNHVGLWLADKSDTIREYSRLQETIQEESLSQLRKRITDAIHRLILEYYENDGELEAYLQRAVENISTRIKCAADNGNLCCIFR